ncbi:hypothetical protein KIPB_006604, partial [Kipferlia bialata]
TTFKQTLLQIPGATRVTLECSGRVSNSGEAAGGSYFYLDSLSDTSVENEVLLEYVTDSGSFDIDWEVDLNPDGSDSSKSNTVSFFFISYDGYSGSGGGYECTWSSNGSGSYTTIIIVCVIGTVVVGVVIGLCMRSQTNPKETASVSQGDSVSVKTNMAQPMPSVMPVQQTQPMATQMQPQAMMQMPIQPMPAMPAGPTAQGGQMSQADFQLMMQRQQMQFNQYMAQQGMGQVKMPGQM